MAHSPCTLWKCLPGGWAEIATCSLGPTRLFRLVFSSTHGEKLVVLGPGGLGFKLGYPPEVTIIFSSTKNPGIQITGPQTIRNYKICHYNWLTVVLRDVIFLLCTWDLPPRKCNVKSWWWQLHTGSRGEPNPYLLLVEEILHHLGCIKPCK